MLHAFIPSAEQQYDAWPGLAVIHPVSWPDINTQLPDTITAEFVVTEVAVFYPVCASDNGYFCPAITQMFKPL